MRKLYFILLITAFINSNSLSQPPHYQNLVMEGGGIRGFAYVGAFEVLDSLHILKDIKRVGGTSAGAIEAMLLSLGYTISEMKTVAMHIPLKQLNDGFVLGGFRRMKKDLGFFKGIASAAWIEQLIENKTGDGNITFGELHRQSAAKGYKDLYVTGTDLTYQCLRIFSYESYPNMKIKDAVRISMSVPLYFRPVYINDSGVVFQKNDASSLHLMVDGGLLSNYPIEMFDSEQYGACIQNSGIKQNTETLGLLLEKPEQIEYNRSRPGNYPLPIRTVRNYIGALYRTLIDKPNPEATEVDALHRTVTISNMNISGRLRKIHAATINAFMECGRWGVRNFFGIK